MELLKRLYEVSSPSNDEKDMFDFIEEWCIMHYVSYEEHKWGMTITKGISETYPCIVAHMDEVHAKHNGKRIINTDGIVFGYDVAECKQCGIGADDKNGIWVALKMLERLDAVKVAFFVGEEIGCVGSSACDMKFFDDCRFVLQCDRKNGGDFISDAGWTELCDDDFVKKCQIERFGYHKEQGLMTDVMTLKERGLQVACANLSCGYYNPHMASEYTDLKQLQNCLDFVEWICKNVTDVCRHEPKMVRRGYHEYGDWYDDYYGYGYGHGWEKYGDDKAKGSVTSEAYDFIFDELCYYDSVEDAPTVDELYIWWQEYKNGRGCREKKFRKAYYKVVEDLTLYSDYDYADAQYDKLLN